MKKNIEKIERTVVEEVVKYIAIDGREFSNEADCKEWEKDYRCTINKTFKEMNKMFVDPIEIGIPYATEYYTAFVIVPKDENDIVTINAMYRYFDSYGEIVSLNDIGRPIVVHFGDGSSEDDVWNADWIEVRPLEYYRNNLIAKYNDIYHHFGFNCRVTSVLNESEE